jgi:hypothetical protein
LIKNNEIVGIKETIIKPNSMINKNGMVDLHTVQNFSLKIPIAMIIFNPNGGVK